MLVKLVAFAVAGYAGYRYLNQNSDMNNGALAEGQADHDRQAVRDAGPESMRDPVRREWTKTDQELDESFPASDPPGNY